MAEGVVTPPSVDKPDWILNSLQNKLPQSSDNSGVTLGALHENELYAHDFSVRDIDEYWGLNDVKAAFTDEEGNTHRNEFDKYYAETIGDFRGKLEAERFLRTNSEQYSSPMAKREGNRMSIPHVSDAAPDLTGRFFSSNMTKEGQFGKAQFGVRDNAINNFVQLEDGTKTTIDGYLDANDNGLTDDFNKALKFAKNEFGNYKLADNGRPYLEPADLGEKLNTYDELYNQTSEMLGRYGLGDSGWDAVTATLIAAPKGGINFLASAVEGLAVLGQVVSEPLAGEESKLNKFFINSQNMMKGTKIASTDAAMNDWTSYEAMLDMGVDVAYQLLGLVASGGALTAMGASPKVASVIPKLGMTTMSAAPIYDLAKERGLSTAEASALYGVASTGLYALMGADQILVNSLMGRSSRVTSGMLREVAEKALDISVQGGLTKGGIKSFAKNFPDILKNALQQASKTPLTAGVGASVLEAGQELSEQMWDTSVRLLFNQYAEVRDKGLSTNERGGNFSINWEHEIQSWKQAAVGGALGGAIAAGPMRRFMRNDQANDMLADFNLKIIQGRENDIYRMIDRLEAQEAFAPKWKDANTDELTNNPETSQNAEAAKIFRAQVDYMVKLRDSNDLQNFDFNLKEKVNKPIQDNLKAGLLGGISGISNDIVESDALYSKYTSIGKDMSKLVLHVDALKAKLSDMGTASTEAREEIQDKIDRAEIRLNKLRTESQQDYVIEGLYNINVLQNMAKNKSSLNVSGKSFVNLNNEVKNTEDDIQKIESKINAQKEADSNAIYTDTTTFEGISTDRKTQLLEEANTEVFHAGDALIKIVDPENKIPDLDVDTAIAQLTVDKTNKEEVNAYVDALNVSKAVNAYNATDIEPILPGSDAARGLELNKFLTMTENSSEFESEGQVLQEIPQSIKSLLEAEISEYEFSIEHSGNPYTNADKVISISDSIGKRRTHVRNTFTMQAIQDVAPLTQEEHDKLIAELDLYEIQAGLLFEAATENLSNPDNSINENALAILSDKVTRLDNISNSFSNSEFSVVSELVMASRATLNNALENRDIPVFLKELNKLENSIYDAFSKVKDLTPIISTLFPSTVTSLDEYEGLKKTYFYFRGIVSLRSEDFYHMYGDILKDNEEGLKPSIEQRIVIKDTVSSLVANENAMPFRWELNLSTTGDEGGIIPINSKAYKFNDAAYIDGGGGTGKTSVVENAVASIISKRSGKKAFFTSTTDGNKIVNIRKTAKDFGGIEMDESVSTIEELLANPEKLNDIGIIVFDEATLLTEADIKNHIIAIDNYNKDFKNSKDRLKILYGGDFFQNSALSRDVSTEESLSVNKSKGSKVLNSGDGFNATDTLIPKTSRLNFSFRSTNLDLTGISNYFQKVQKSFGKSQEQKGFSYNTVNEGVRVVHNRDKFLKSVESFLKGLSQDEIAETVYITDRSDISSAIVNSGVRIGNSTQVQGEEWNNVIVDLVDVPFKENAHQGNTKKSYYTAVTRAKKFVLMTLPESQQITSKRGKVFNVELGKMQDATRENEMIAVENVLGTSISKPSDGPQRVTNIKNTTPLQSNIFVDSDSSGNIRETLSNFLSSFNDNAIKLHTFFTAQRADGTEKQNLEEIFALKRKLIYSDFKDLSGSTGYRLVLAKQGSVAYTNVVRNDPQYEGNYALFLEGVDKNPTNNLVTETIIGVFGDSTKDSTFNQDLNQLVKDSGIFNSGANSIVMELDRSIFTNEPIHAGSGRGKKDTTLNELKANSPGIGFGTIRIFQKSIDRLDDDGKLKASINAGQAFIPVSFKLNKAEIDRELTGFKDKDIRNHPDITPIFIKGKFQTTQDMFETLEPFLETYKIGDKEYKWFPRNEKNNFLIKKGAFTLSTELGSAYASTIGRFANSNSLNEDYSIFTTALTQVYDEAIRDKADAKYIEFLKQWVGGSSLDTTIKNAFDVDSSILDIDKLVNTSTNVKTNKPYFFFQHYVEAQANNRFDLPHYQLAMEQMQSVFIQIDRTDPTDATKTISEPVQQFKNGFEFSVVAEKKSGENSASLKSIQNANPALYDEKIQTSKVENISQPTINIDKTNLIDSLLGSEVVIPEGSGTIEDGPVDLIEDDELGGDGEEITLIDPISTKVLDDEIEEGISLIDFQEKYYPKSNVNRMIRGIDKFKRSVWNNIFHLTGEVPTMNNIDTALNNYKSRIDGVKAGMEGKGEFFLTDENEQYYHDAVASSAFDFLIQTYFPVLQKTETGYETVVTSHKGSLYNKETISLLDDTANEMVKTMLFNTRELYKKNGKLHERNNYLSQNDIEDMTDIFSNSMTNENLIASMKSHVDNSSGNTVNPAILSIYHQFYADIPYKIAGSQENSHSLRSINVDGASEDVRLPYDMVEGLSVFLRTAAAYKYAFVDINGVDSAYRGRPTPGGERPNLLKNTLHDTFKGTAPLIKDSISINDNRSLNLKIDSETSITIPNRGSMDNNDIVKAFNHLGLTRFTNNVLNEIIKVKDDHPDTVLIELTNIIRNIATRANNIDIQSEDAVNDSFQRILTREFTTYLVEPLARIDGMHSENTYKNLNGDKVNRLRNKIALHNFKVRLSDIRSTPNSVFSDNMLVKRPTADDGSDTYKSYEIVDWVAKDGFKRFNKGFVSTKRHSAFINSETVEYDVVWNFYNTVKDLSNDSGSETFALFSPMVYSDGSTDMMAQVKLVREQLENPKKVLEALFASRKASYSKMKSLVDAGKYPIKGLHKDDFYQENIRKYVNGTFEAFHDEMVVELNTFKKTLPVEIKNAVSTPIAKLGLKNSDDVLKAFYYNWVAVSSEITDITLGKLDNFKVGKSEHDKYIDFAKRAKMQVSNRSNMLFRNDSWSQKVADFKAINSGVPLPIKLHEEGMKLQRVVKVAYVEDLTTTLSTLDMSRYNKELEVLDGATFANPISKIYQQSSSGGQFGIKVPVVSKPVTNALEPLTGVGIGIKNAEFTITAEILRNGTSIVHNIMDNMLGATKPLLEEIVADRLNDVEGDGEIEINVYDVVLEEDFETLSHKLVEENLQDELIQEVIPLSSRKYGGGIANDLTSDKPFTTELLDLSNKGQQLDASHDVNEHSDLSMLTQYLNTLAINYKNPVELNSIYQSVGKMVDLELVRWNNLAKKGKTVNHIRGLVKDAINKRVGVSYQHQLVNKTKFNLSDRQLYKNVISQINSVLEENGVRIKLFGSQYVLHPQSTLVNLVRTDKGVFKKSEVSSGATIIEENTDLQWASPSLNGVPLEENETYIALREKYINTSNKTKELLQEFQNDVDTLLSSGDWEAGFAEMMLPMSLANQFNITEEDINKPLSEFNEKFFNSKDKAEDFRRALEMLNVRIPTTAKHSGVVAKVVGFMNSSDNSVFVPPMLLFVQGADQDIDKGNIAGLQAIDGIIPELDDDFKPTEKTTKHFTVTNGRLADNVYAVALSNKIVQGMKDISSSPLNAVEGNSAVDALLQDMKKLVTKKSKDVFHKKDSYTSYVKLRRDNQAGKALVGIFANAQKAYQTLYGYSKISGQSTGVNVDEVGLNRIAETFAALINASTDNAKEQILGPLGINESNANMVGYMIMTGKTIQEVAEILEKNSAAFKKLENSTHYASKPFNPRALGNSELIRFYNGGKELALIGSSILNTSIPNSPYDSFKYQYKINTYVTDILKEEFNFEKFLNDTSEAYANDFIAKMDDAINDSRNPASFNILKILNPYSNTHPSNFYTKLYKQSRNLKTKTVKIVNHVDTLVSEYMNVFNSGNAVQDTLYEDATGFIYGMGMHDFLSTPAMEGLRHQGEFDLADIRQRSAWVNHFNEITIHELKRKYNNRDDENLFISSLRQVPIKKFPYNDSITYSLPDLRNLDEATILTYDVSFNNKNLLDAADKQQLILYNLITTGGKHGKGSFAQIFRYNEPLLEAFNEHLNDFLDTLTTEGMSDVFNGFLKNTLTTDKKLLSNALPYGYSNDVEEKSTTDTYLKLDKENTVDSVISGDKDALSLTDSKLNSTSILKNLVELFDAINKPRGEVLSSISKIINAGGTGVEAIALRAAGDILNIPTGGTIKQGFITEGSLKNQEGAEKYGLVEGGVTVSKDNVENSDVTIIFGDIKDSEITTTIKHAKKLNKPVLVQAGPKTAAAVGQTLRNEGVNHVMFTSGTELREILKNNNYGTLNITGSKGSKLSSLDENIVFKILVKALTEDKSISYRSVTGSDLSNIVSNDDESFTYYDSHSNAIEVENVYYAKIPADIQAQLNEGIKLIPTVNRNNELVRIDSSEEVANIIAAKEKVALSLYRGDFPVPNSKAVELILSPQRGASVIMDDRSSDNQLIINSISSIDKGLVEKEVQTSVANLQGYTSSGVADITYHGKLTSAEATTLVPDRNSYPKTYSVDARGKAQHTFTINVRPVSIVYDRLDASMPETYDFDKDGNVSKRAKSKIDIHLKTIIRENNVDTAKAYLNDFGTNNGGLFVEALTKLSAHFDNFSDYTDELSPETRSLIDASIQEGTRITDSSAKEIFLVNTLSSANGKSLGSNILNSLKRDIGSYDSEIELKHYIAKVFKNVKNLTVKDKNSLLEAYGNRMVAIGGSVINTTKRRKYSTSKVNRGSVNSRNTTTRRTQVKAGRTQINMTELTSIIESYNDTPAEMKSLVNQTIAQMTANMSGTNIIKAVKLMQNVNIDNGTISEFLEIDVTQEGEGNTAVTVRVDTLIHSGDIDKFKNLMSDFGHVIETDNISLFDITEEGTSIIEALHTIANSNESDENEKDFANLLIIQHESMQNDYSQEEIDDISKVCG